MYCGITVVNDTKNVASSKLALQSIRVTLLSGEVVDVAVTDYLLTPLEVVNKTGPGRQKELNSQATPITMIWLVSGPT